jgi:hypothetical protein
VNYAADDPHINPSFIAAKAYGRFVSSAGLHRREAAPRCSQTEHAYGSNEFVIEDGLVEGQGARSDLLFGSARLPPVQETAYPIRSAEKDFIYR